jgi:hypothetical protein
MKVTHLIAALGLTVEVAGGAELTYRTADAKLAAALHSWFDAQVSDHGPDAMPGQMQHHRGSMTRPEETRRSMT